ncbi:MAG: hypothetical protein Q8876_00195 [Bacillota bacterium]|nr:hypothetical protein [Bacillota bacterium]
MSFVISELRITENRAKEGNRLGRRLFLLLRVSRKEVLAFLEESEKTLRDQVIDGYKKLAFGSISDCIRAMCSENMSDEELMHMDLFNVSQVKGQNGRIIEMKFFDRMKALEKLETTESEQEKKGEPSFYKALREGVEALQKNNVEPESDAV